VGWGGGGGVTFPLCLPPPPGGYKGFEVLAANSVYKWLVYLP
jgi:hypothetical protein